LESDELDTGGLYLRYSPDPPPSRGISSVTVERNYVESWRLDHRRDAPIFAQVYVDAVQVLELGRVASRLRARHGKVASVAKYVVSLTSFDDAHPVLPRAHHALLGRDGRALPGFPELDCHLVYGFASADAEKAGRLTGELLQRPAVPRDSKDFGGSYWELPGPGPSALVRKNRLSLVTWLYPRHQSHELLLHLSLTMSNLLEAGALALDIEERAGSDLSLVGYRVAGDIIRDNLPRLLTFETEGSNASSVESGAV
jgi:hypothetical protein